MANIHRKITQIPDPDRKKKKQSEKPLGDDTTVRISGTSGYSGNVGMFGTSTTASGSHSTSWGALKSKGKPKKKS